jgi:hypothetical protein
LSDDRLEAFWKAPSRYALEFKQCGILSLVEIDFSMWADDSTETQLFNIRRQKIVSRIFQDFGLAIAPCLNWSGPESFEFCFSGVPSHCPLAYIECRTASSSAEDKRAFSCGLHEAIRQVRPQTLVIYGGLVHRWWIERDLPVGPTRFVFLESWTDARGKIRKVQEQRIREKNQLNLFSTGGHSVWEEEAAAAPRKEKVVAAKVRQKVRRAILAVIMNNPRCRGLSRNGMTAGNGR